MPHDEDATRQVAFFAGGERFETWKDWSLAAATFYLPPNTVDWAQNPSLATPLQEGMTYYNTTSERFRVYTGTDVWKDATEDDLVLTGLVTFSQMPLVGVDPDFNQIMPEGGTAGQVLAKVDGDDFNTDWTDPASGTFDTNFDYSITGLWTIATQWIFQLGMRISNSQELLGRNAADDSNLSLASITASDVARFGSESADSQLHGQTKVSFGVGGVFTAEAVPLNIGGLLVGEIGGTLRKAGFRNPGIIGIAAGSPFTQEMEGQDAQYTADAGNLTVDQLEPSTEIGLDQNGTDGTSITLIEGAGVTLSWKDGSGVSKQGGRTIAANSFVALKWRTATLVDLVGNGIS